MVGLMELSGVLPGAIAFAAPCTRPNMLGDPGLLVKSSISLFSRTPVPGATRWMPNQSFSVYVTETAFPSWSMTENWVVFIPSCGGIALANALDGVAWLGSILARIAAA